MSCIFRHILFVLGVSLSVCQLSACGLIKQTSEQKQETDTHPLFKIDPIQYDVAIRVTDLKKGDHELRAAMEKHSQLVQLRDQPPDGMLGLMRRARADQKTALRLMHSLGYYDGEAEIKVIEPAVAGKTAEVILVLAPGRLYHIGKTQLSYHPAPSALPAFPGVILPSPPLTLAGLNNGQAAEADAILSAVENIPAALHRSGFPAARVSSSRYTLDKNRGTLNAEVTVDPGPATVMGDAKVKGTEKVDPEYLRKLVTWQQGEPWDERRLLAYRQELQSLGLFRGVEVKPAPLSEGTLYQETSAILLPVLVDVRESSFRTISASARYATDTGMGIQGEWQHRNLFGAGEKLTLKTPFAQDKRGIQADFEKPCFDHRDQKLLAGTSYFKEETDAYDTTAVNGYLGLERKLSPIWWTSMKAFGEEGSVTRGNKDEYRYGSLILALRRDTRNSILNPTAGTYVQWEAAPTAGYYNGNFSGTLARMTASGYYPLLDDDLLVLAARMSFGSFLGTELHNIPPSLRFYCGGGGSVRGYTYQAIGPKDLYGDPLGGRSFQEINLEARFRVTEHVGLVPFLDGGMVYGQEMPRLFEDLQWGAGLGVRYYTPIGPIRFDVAVPLDKKTDDRGYQFYISIGQAF